MITKQLRSPDLLLSVLIAVIIILAGGLAGGIVAAVVLDLWLLSPGPTLAVNLVCSFGAVLVVLRLWLRVIEKQSPWGRWFPHGRLRFYFAGWGLGLVLFALGVSVAHLLGLFSWQFSGRVAWALIIGWAIQGATEEIIMRGWLLDKLQAKTEPVTAVIISTLVFVLLHSLNPGITFLALVNLALFGVFAALVVLKTQNLWAVCGIHSAWNLAQGNIFSMPISGHPPTGDSIFNLVATGPAWLTGGGFGLEASVITTGVLWLSISIVVYFYGWRSLAHLRAGETVT